MSTKPSRTRLIMLLLTAIMMTACGPPEATDEPPMSPQEDTPVVEDELETSTFPSSIERPDLLPVRAGSWSMVPVDPESDWETFMTPTFIGGIVLDGIYIWAASSGGLLRWDRSSGEVLQHLAPAVPLANNHLSQILLLNDTLYMSGRGGLAIYDREGQWQVYDEDEIGLELGYRTPLAEKDGEIWIAGDDGIAQLSADGIWETHYLDAEFRSDEIGSGVVAIATAEQGLYVQVATGLPADEHSQSLLFSDGEWTPVDMPNLTYLQSPDGVLWKGDDETVLTSSDDGQTWEVVFEHEDDVTPLAYDDEGRLYVSSDDTILVLREGEIVERYCFTDYGPHLNYINIIREDEDGRVWIATDGWGMSMFDGSTWRYWEPGNSDMREDAVRGLQVANGKVIAGTHSCAGCGGLNILDIETEQWVSYWPDNSPLSGGGVGGIAIDSDGKAYLPTSFGVLDIYDGENWEHIPMPLPDRYMLTTEDGLIDANGDYWVGTGGLGLWRYDGETWYVYAIEGTIYALAMDQAGRLWISGEIGLVVRDEHDVWHLYTSEELPFETGWFSDLAIDADGRIWMSSPSDLFVFNGREFQSFDPGVVGEGSWGGALAFSQDGSLWVEAGDGLARFRGEPEIGSFAGIGLRPYGSADEADLLVDAEEMVAP